MATVGYARVSTSGQKLTVQRDKLLAYGCDKLFEEKQSAMLAQRPKLKECLRYLREGDVLVVTRIDRLARSTLELHRIMSTLKDEGIGFKALDQEVDTTTKTGKLLFGMLALIAEFEQDLRKERQTEGIAAAKAKGVQFGRPPRMSVEQVAELRQKRTQGVMIRDLMQKYGLSKSSVYRLLTKD